MFNHPKSKSKVFSNENSKEELKLNNLGYNIGKFIGVGKYAKVFFATFKKNEGGSSFNSPDNTDTNIKEDKGKIKKLAVKVIDLKKCSKDYINYFFPREITIMRKINHKNLVRVHSIIQMNQKKIFVFMNYYENGDLFEFIKKWGAVEEDQAKIWYFQIINGLKYLHEELKVAHRDLKLENILISKCLTAKISDFGFSREFDREKDILSKTFCGTTEFTPPEILIHIDYDPMKGDLWSLGCILFSMLSKSFPYSSNNPRNPNHIVSLQMAKKYKLRKEIKEKLSQICLVFLDKTMEPKPELRLNINEQLNDPWFIGLFKV